MAFIGYCSKAWMRLGIGVVAGSAIVYVDNYSFEGEVSPIVIVAMLFAATTAAGAIWGRRGWVASSTAWACVPLAHLLKHFLSLPDTLPLSLDSLTGEYTRLTRFLPGADTSRFGGRMHPYPEEVFIVSGRVHDQAFDLRLEAGHYASRPPGELHGPFKTDRGCVVLEVSFPQRVAAGDSANPALPRETPQRRSDT